MKLNIGALVGAGTLLLAGCAGNAVEHYVAPPEGKARIRVFHGPAIYLFPGKACFTADTKSALRAARGGYSFLAKNRRLGMPPTADLPWSFHEFSVAAGEPLTVMMYWGARGSTSFSSPLGVQSQVHGESCGPVAYTFVPESGKDYDTRMIMPPGYCRAELRELRRPTADAVNAEATPLAPAPAGLCPAPPEDAARSGKP